MSCSPQWQSTPGRSASGNRRGVTDTDLFAVFRWSPGGLVVCAALLVGASFGMYPALRASRLMPIDAISRQ